MKRNILIFTMMRSGNHAIINWLARSSSNQVTDYNFSPHGWEKGRLLPGNPKEYIEKYGGELPERVIFSQENFDLNWIDEHKFIKKFGSGFYWIIIIRDPFNWLASYKKKFKGTHLTKPWTYANGLQCIPAFEIYKQYVDQALGVKDYTAGKKQIHIINYNEWVDSKKYRDETAYKFLGTESNEDALNVVPRFGGGSSFDGLNYNGKARKMKIMERYKSFIQDEEFNRLALDDKIQEANNKIFKMIL